MWEGERRRLVIVSVCVTAGCFALVLGLSFAARRLPICRMSVVKRKHVILYRTRPHEGLGRIRKRTKSDRLVFTDLPAAGRRGYALDGDVAGCVEDLRGFVRELCQRPDTRVVICHGPGSAYGVCLAAYRVVHDGWTLADARREMRIRLGGRPVRREAMAALEQLAREAGCKDCREVLK
jgi:hypothetical protein